MVLNLTDEQKTELRNILDSMINDTINEEWYREYDMTKVRRETPLLNATYVHGEAIGMLKVVEKVLGNKEYVDIAEKYNWKLNTFTEVSNDIYDLKEDK